MFSGFLIMFSGFLIMFSGFLIIFPIMGLYIRYIRFILCIIIGVVFILMTNDFKILHRTVAVNAIKTVIVTVMMTTAQNTCRRETRFNIYDVCVVNSCFTGHVALSWGQTEAVVVYMCCTCLITCVRQGDGGWALNLGQAEVVVIHKGCTCCLRQFAILFDWAITF